MRGQLLLKLYVRLIMPSKLLLRYETNVANGVTSIEFDRKDIEMNKYYIIIIIKILLLLLDYYNIFLLTLLHIIIAYLENNK